MVSGDAGYSMLDAGCGLGVASAKERKGIKNIEYRTRNAEVMTDDGRQRAEDKGNIQYRIRNFECRRWG